MTEKKPLAGSAKARFSEAAFGTLRATIGAENRGEPIRIALSAIDEDENQPRKRFDADELASLAESVKERGVLQPIVVRPPVDGRYRLVIGARRLRAAKLAGLPDIPALIRRAEDDDFTAQVIENQQRANLSNSELAAAVARLVDEGKSTREIGALCNLKDYQVAALRKVDAFPLPLRERIDQADIRALYDLFRQWTKTPDAVLAALPSPETYLTVTEARRILAALTQKPTGSLVLDRPDASAPREVIGAAHGATPAPCPSAAPRAANSPPLPVSATKGEPPAHKDPPSAEASATARPFAPSSSTRAPKANDAPVFFVAAGDGQIGRLVVDRRAERPGWALVAYASGIEEIEAVVLRIIRIE